MFTRSVLRSSILAVAVVALMVSIVGCGSVNMRCDGAGGGYSCTQIDGPPEQHSRTSYQPVWSDEYYDLAYGWSLVSDEVVSLTNAERNDRGRSVLREDATLSQIACWHNQDMLGHGYMGHEDSDDRMPSDRVAREHRRLIGTVGENTLTTGRMDRDASRESQMRWAESIMRQWMNSTGHRSNILDRDWTHLGACVSQDSSASRGTQVFAQAWAYLEEPLPWTMSPGDSIAVSFQLEKAPAPPRRYEWAPAGENLAKAFNEGTGQPLTEKLYLPESTGTYALRVLVPKGGGRYTVVGGPRVWVKPPGEPAY
ncbi:CAP domain-containing protein [Longibacter salinarum]|nr:CAP domain-containing protein [Longibacter salinarum]